MTDNADIIARAQLACSNALQLCVHALALHQHSELRRGKTLNDLITIRDAAPPDAPHCPFCGKRDCTDHIDLDQELMND